MSPGNRRSRLALLALAFIVTLLAAYGIWSRRPLMQPGSGIPSRRITVAQFGDFFLYAPLYVALDGGFFSRQALDVTIVSTGPSLPI